MKRPIQIIIKVAELFDDACAKIHFTGKNRAENEPKSADYQEGAEDKNKDVLMRSFQNALASCQAMLSDYTPDIHGHVGSDTILDKTANIIFVLMVPENFKPKTEYSLAQLIHMYLVDEALVDWFEQVLPGDDKAYYKSRNIAAANLRNALTLREKPGRTSINPDIVPFTNIEIE